MKEIYNEIDSLKNDLIDLSHQIHSNPEIKWQEFSAVKNIETLLNKYNIQINKVKDLPTAFTASIKGNSKGPVIALLAEYDALPGIGAFLGFLALKGNFPGEIRLIGTPAEEGGGGKISLLGKNYFDDVDISLSSHGSSNTTILWEDVPMGTGMSLATSKAIYEFHGKASHAAINPDQGINALNAVIMLFNGIDSLRQHVKDDTRIHGIITDGGMAPNIVPDFAAADILMRSRSSSYVEYIREKIDDIAKGAALMTGAELKIREDEPGYKHVIPNTTLAKIGKSILQELEINLTSQPLNRFGSGASTDFGNVSHEMPSYAFNFAVSEEPVAGHSTEMEKASISDLAHDNAIVISKGISATALTLLEDADQFNKSKLEFEKRKNHK